MSELSVLTPFPIPDRMRLRKVPNLGDGFILRAVERLLGYRFSSSRMFSPRVAPDAKARRIMADSAMVIVAGANQLNDEYTIWPGLQADEIRAGHFRVVPFGVGIHGEAGRNIRMSDETRNIIEAIHENIEYSSWRCPRTLAYLEREIPHLKGRFLLTGCPVVFDQPLLEGRRFLEKDRVVAVTVTERGNFWEREAQTLEFVARRFQHAKRILVLHQNFERSTPLRRLSWKVRSPLPTRASAIVKLHCLAMKLGYKVVAPESVESGLRLYRKVDLHIGSRLHAHLLLLSHNKRSFLIPVDERARGAADLFGFSLCDPSKLDSCLGADFEVVRATVRERYCVMERFLAGIVPHLTH